MNPEVFYLHKIVDRAVFLSVCGNPQATIFFGNNFFPRKLFQVNVRKPRKGCEYEHITDKALAFGFYRSGYKPLKLFFCERTYFEIGLLQLVAKERRIDNQFPMQGDTHDFEKHQHSTRNCLIRHFPFHSQMKIERFNKGQV